MYYFGRIIGAFFNQLFRWLFWNKTGQKLLFSILIVFIFFCFIKLGEVSAVEEVNDINYEVQSYYDGLFNEFILRFDYALKNNYSNALVMKDLIVNNELQPYVYAGQSVGASYENSRPINNSNIFIFLMRSGAERTTTSRNTDYLGVTGYSMIDFNFTYNQYLFQFFSGGVSYTNPNRVIMPYFPITYTPNNWVTYLTALRNNDNQTIIELLSSIEDSLTNTEPTSETDSFVNVDTSSTDSISSTAVDNVASNVLSNLENKVNNYNPSTDYSFVWTIMGTTITFHSNMIYNLIKDTFLYDLIQMLWYFITGHYCFAFLSNLIHSIKDGSILDGFHPNEVISKEVL